MPKGKLVKIGENMTPSKHGGSLKLTIPNGYFTATGLDKTRPLLCDVFLQGDALLVEFRYAQEIPGRCDDRRI